VLHCGVRAYLLSAPRWVLALVQGVFFGAGMTVFSLVTTDRHWVGAVAGGAVGGVLFGAVMAPIAHRQNRGVREASGLTAADQQRAAVRASMRGPIPLEPDIREAAHRIALQQRRELLSKRTFSVVTFAAITTLNVFLAITASPWWWLTVLFFVSLSSWQLWWLPRHLARRADRLRPGDPAQSDGDIARRSRE
jgi:hypothetical protein